MEHLPRLLLWDHPIIELAGRTLGIIGYGSIGAAVSQIALAFGMKVLANHHTWATPPPAGVRNCPAPDLSDLGLLPSLVNDTELPAITTTSRFSGAREVGHSARLSAPPGSRPISGSEAEHRRGREPGDGLLGRLLGQPRLRGIEVALPLVQLLACLSALTLAVGSRSTGSTAETVDDIRAARGSRDRHAKSLTGPPFERGPRC